MAVMQQATQLLTVEEQSSSFYTLCEVEPLQWTANLNYLNIR